MRYVIDASVAFRWFISGSEHPNADAVLQEIITHPGIFAIPELFAYEVLSVLYKHHPMARTVYAKDIDRLMRSGILRYPMTENISARADRFIRMGLTGYDAVYVALAEELDGTWLTFDSRAHARIENENLSCDLFASRFSPEG